MGLTVLRPLFHYDPVGPEAQEDEEGERHSPDGIRRVNSHTAGSQEPGDNNCVISERPSPARPLMVINHQAVRRGAPRIGGGLPELFLIAVGLPANREPGMEVEYDGMDT